MSNNTTSSKSDKKKRNKKKKRQNQNKQDLSDSSLIYYDSSDDSDYRRKQRKKKSHRKKDPLKLCARLTEKLLTTVYKLKIIRFKLDKDALQRYIHFLKFVESLDTIFYQYKETREVILDYPRIGGEDIKDLKKSIGNILHENIDVRRRRLISEFPGYGIN